MRIKDSFLIQEELKEINSIIDNRGYTFGWKSNTDKEYKHWNLNFAGSANWKEEHPINQEDIEYPILWQIWNKINVNQDRKLVRLYSNAYTYGTEGDVHTDSHNASSITHLIYINDIWNVRWAGETIFLNNFADEIQLSVIPKPGRMVEFSGVIKHAARSITKYCPVLRKVLVYKSIKA